MSARRKTVLVIDPQDEARERLAQTLRRDYRVVRASSAEAGLALMEREDVDVLVADVTQPGLGGIDLLQIVRENFPLVEIIMTSAAADVDGAVKAIKLGAYHFLTKDADPDVLRALVRHAGERQDLNRHVLTLQDAAGDAGAREFITGPSTALKDVLETVHKVAKLSATVLILGESGTGKELLARLLHRESVNPEAPFIAVNVAAIPRELVESTLFGHEKGAFTGAIRQQLGKFELAAGGTLFLDEVGDVSPKLQLDLLRVLEERRFQRVGGSESVAADVRVVAATNRDLAKAVADGSFREDLFYRLNVIAITLPPLRERPEDIPLLVQHFLDRLSKDLSRRLDGVSPEAMAALVAHAWPGNVRELRNVLERGAVVAKGNIIQLADLGLPAPDPTRAPAPTGDPLPLEEVEKRHVADVLSWAGGNVTHAARVLGIDRMTLYNKMKRWGLHRPEQEAVGARR
jgi:two-component system, NtrC family, response regulator AtoC